MGYQNVKRISASLTAIAALILPLQQAQAQGLEEIVVTAQRRSQDLQDVPVSVTAFSGAELERLGVVRPQDVFAQSPNVTLVGDTIFPQLNIRGVQAYDFGGGNEPPVGIYFDDVYAGSVAGLMSQLFDQERAEVLRGPQGTLFGRNTTGGLAHFISNKPTENFEARASLQYGSYEQRIAEGMLSGPLSASTRGRVALLYNVDDGWQKNATLGTRLGATDIFSGRALLEVDLGADAQLLLNVHGTRQRNTSEGFAILGKLDPATGATCSAPRILAGECANAFGFIHGDPEPTRVFSDTEELKSDIDSIGGSASVNWQTGAVDLVSITAYDKSERLYQEDVDGPFVLGRADFSVDSEQFSQEIRLSGGSERLNWVVGTFYYNDKKDNLNVTTPQLTAALGTTFGLQNEATLDTESWAVFGQGEYELTEKLSVIAGLRYTSEDKSLVIADSFAAPLFVERESASAERVTWKGGLNWRIAEDTLAYASVASGFKSSAFNTVLVTPGLAKSVGQEENINYEVGLKTDALFDGKLRFNSAVFYNDYRDIQVITLQDIGGFPAVVFLNGGDMKLYGGEVELTAVPTDRLQLGLGAGYLEGEIDAPPALLLRGIPLDGKTSPHAPEISLSALIRYTIDLASAGKISLQTTGTYESEVFFEPNNDPLTAQDSIFILNGRISWDSQNERYSAEVFVDNILNEELVYNGFDFSAFGLVARLWQPPRRAGVKVAARF